MDTVVAPLITEEERAQRQKAVNTGRDSVRLEGFHLPAEVEDLERPLRRRRTEQRRTHRRDQAGRRLMPPDPAVEGREAALVSNRIRELSARPPIGEFDRTHLQAVHAYLFQDLPQHRPGEVRSDSSGWSKTRMLEGQLGAHDVHYAADNVAGRVDKILREAGGPAALSGLSPDACRRAHGAPLWRPRPRPLVLRGE